MLYICDKCHFSLLQAAGGGSGNIKVTMKLIKVLLSSRPKLFSEVIRNMIEHQPDMEVVGEIIDPVQLLLAVRTTLVHVVIVTPLESSGEPKICRHLLAEYPELKVVTLSADGQAAYLYQTDVARLQIDEPSAQSILSAIRERMNPNEKDKTI